MPCSRLLSSRVSPSHRPQTLRARRSGKRWTAVCAELSGTGKRASSATQSWLLTAICATYWRVSAAARPYTQLGPSSTPKSAQDGAQGRRLSAQMPVTCAQACWGRCSLGPMLLMARPQSCCTPWRCAEGRRKARGRTAMARTDPESATDFGWHRVHPSLPTLFLTPRTPVSLTP